MLQRDHLCKLLSPGGNMGRRLNRRGFLKSTAVAGTGCALIGQGAPARGAQSGDRLRIALIGVGERGRGFIGKVERMEHDLVAVCDVDRYRIDNAPALPSGVKVFRDYRELLSEMGDQLDAVIVATPHHSQAAISAAAIRAGKHVYCEKPIAHDVGEARALRELVGKHNVVTQMGNQGVSSDAFRRVLEQVQDGALGEVREAHQWFVTDPNRRRDDDRQPPADPTAIPEGFDWDLYLGPAAERPYHYDFMRWAAWRPFGTGMLGMGGSHSCHMTFNALNLRALWEGNDGAPATIRIEAECSAVGEEKFPEWEVVRFQIPARGDMPPVKLSWHKGTKEDLERLGAWQRLEQAAGRSLDWGGGWAPTSGSLVIGEKGMVHTNMHNSECALLPLDRFPDQDGRPQRLPRAGSHEREWANACIGKGPKPFSNFDYAGPVLELLLLGNICTLLGRPIEFDPVACKILNDEESDRALRPPRRPGWEV
jgi:hypothetical protein